VRVISLNVWLGFAYDKLERFLKDQKATTDVFCFQEVLMEPRTASPASVKIMEKHGGAEPVYDLYQRLQKALPGFTGVPSEPYSDAGTRLAMFFREAQGAPAYSEAQVLDALASHDVLGTGMSQSQSVRLQCMRFPGGIVVANTHGASIWGVYGDCLERAVQSRRILSLLGMIPGRKLLLGDLNLRPGMEGIRILESEMRNLVNGSGATTTRSSLTAKETRGIITDYAFASPELAVKKFRVLPDEASDHLPLLVEC
jgi:endonuclease/exonuclease/phosphatase family metal-dependent hydrolase